MPELVTVVEPYLGASVGGAAAGVAVSVLRWVVEVVVPFIVSSSPVCACH